MNGEFLFHYYFQTMGTARSLAKLSRYCASEGMINLDGNPPTRMGLMKAMWRWALKKENQKDAYEIYTNSELGALFPVINSWDEWLEFLRNRVESAYQHGGIRERNKWMNQNGYS